MARPLRVEFAGAGTRRTADVALRFGERFLDDPAPVMTQIAPQVVVVA
jgi:hypothetical protein